jgi:hypothetical protein
MMQRTKLYAATIGIDIFIAQLHYWDFWEHMDEGLKRLTMLAALIVTIMTILKLYQDITKTRLEKKKLRLEIKKQEVQS